MTVQLGVQLLSSSLVSYIPIPNPSTNPEPALHVVTDEQTPVVGPAMLLKNGKEWECPAALANKICKASGIDADPFLEQCEKAALWLVNNPGRRKTQSGMGRYLSGWIKRNEPQTTPSEEPMRTPEQQREWEEYIDRLTGVKP